MNYFRGIGLVALLLVAAAGFTGCSGAKTAEERTSVTKAMAILHPTQGNSVEGTVTFTKEKNGIHVVARVTGLKPGLHGFHVHEFGDCSAADGRSAGDHFNPSKMPHAGPQTEKRHAGDLGNIEADQSGAGKYDVVDTHMTLDGPNAIVGRGLIVHALPDDFTTQPTGGAGARIACGVIGIVK